MKHGHENLTRNFIAILIAAFAFEMSAIRVEAAKRKTVIVRVVSESEGGTVSPGSKRIKLRRGQSRTFLVKPDQGYSGKLYVRKGIKKPDRPRLSNVDNSRRKSLMKQYRLQLRKYRSRLRDNHLSLARVGEMDQAYSYRLRSVRASSAIAVEFGQSAFFINTADPVLGVAQTSEGSIEYIGTREPGALGLPSVVTQVNFTNHEGGLFQFFIDEYSGELNKIITDEGLSITWSLISGTLYRVSFLSEDGTDEQVIVVDTADTGAHAHAHGDALVEGGTEHGKAQNQGGFEVEADPSQQISWIHVLRCGQPIEGEPLVRVFARSEDGSSERFPATAHSAGLFMARLPTLPAPTDYASVDFACKSWATATGVACSVIDAGVKSGALPLACFKLLAVPVAGPALAAACLKASAVAGVLCVSGPPGVPSLLQAGVHGVCLAMEVAVDAGRDFSGYIKDRVFTEPLTLQADAILDGEVAWSDPVSWLPGDPLPDFTISFPDEAAISNFSTSPENPSPGQDYVATVYVFCVPPPPGTVVTLSISGTDGYTSSTTCTVFDDGSCSLAVPGAAQGVLDTVTATLPNGKSRSLTVLF